MSVEFTGTVIGPRFWVPLPENDRPASGPGGADKTPATYKFKIT